MTASYQPRVAFRLEQDGFVYVDFDGEFSFRVSISWLAGGMAWDVRQQVLAVHPLLTDSEQAFLVREFEAWHAANREAVAIQWRRRESRMKDARKRTWERFA